MYLLIYIIINLLIYRLIYQVSELFMTHISKLDIQRIVFMFLFLWYYDYFLYIPTILVAPPWGSQRREP